MVSKNDMIQLERAKFWTDKGILFCEICNTNETRHLNEETIDSYIGAISKLCNGKKMPFLIDLRNAHGTFLSTSAKKIANNANLSKLSLTEAFVVNSLKIKLLIISYKRIYEPKIPYIIIDNMEDALKFCLNMENNDAGDN